MTNISFYMKWNNFKLKKIHWFQVLWIVKLFLVRWIVLLFECLFSVNYLWCCFQWTERSRTWTWTRWTDTVATTTLPPVRVPSLPVHPHPYHSYPVNQLCAVRTHSLPSPLRSTPLPVPQLCVVSHSHRGPLWPCPSDLRLNHSFFGKTPRVQLPGPTLFLTLFAHTTLSLCC